MKKPETMPLYIAITPFGVYLQSCVECGCDQYKLVDDNNYLACAECGSKIAVFDPVFTAALEGKGGCDNCMIH